MNYTEFASMSVLEIAIMFAVSLFLTATLNLALPTFLILSKKKYTEKKIKKIAIINSIVVFIIFSIMEMSESGNTANLPAALLWFFIAKALMMRFCLLEETDEISENSTCISEKIVVQKDNLSAQKEDIRICFSEVEEKTPLISYSVDKYAVYGNDLKVKERSNSGYAVCVKDLEINEKSNNDLTINMNPQQYNENKSNKVSKTTPKKIKVVCVLLTLACITLVGLNVYSFNKINELEDEVLKNQIKLTKIRDLVNNSGSDLMVNSDGSISVNPTREIPIDEFSKIMNE